MTHSLLVVAAFASLAIFDTASADNNDELWIPSPNEILKVPPQYLAAGYLAVEATISQAETYVDAGWKFENTLDGETATITASNLQKYLKAYRGRLDVYRNEIEKRGYAQISGRHGLEIDPSCRLQPLDFGEFFALTGPSDTVVLADELRIDQKGFRADLILVPKNPTAAEQEPIRGVVVEQAVVFGAGSLGFNFWGSVEKGMISLRLETEEVRQAFGAVPEASQRAISECVFKLKKLN